MGKYEGRRSSFKKAIVKLTTESKGIEFFEGLQKEEIENGIKKV